jgi:hypothetical protein
VLDAAPGVGLDPAVTHLRSAALPAARWVAATVARSDLALVYTAAVLAVFGYVHWRSQPLTHLLVVQSSTNLENLRDHPFNVMLTSAFVVAAPEDLWLLPALALACALGQRWLGRTAVVVTMVIGHVLATLVVATLLVTGIAHGQLSPAVSRAADVGFSYGLACLSGLLLGYVPHRWKLGYVLAVVVAWSWSILLGPPWVNLVRPSFTDVGHLVALLTGIGLSTLTHAEQATADRAA